MWRALLMVAVTASNKTKVAANLDVSRSTISLIMHDKYSTDSRRIASRVLEVYCKAACPHLEQEISQAQCTEYPTRLPQISSPRALKLWRACQNFCHNAPNQNNHEEQP